MLFQNLLDSREIDAGEARQVVDVKQDLGQGFVHDAVAGVGSHGRVLLQGLDGAFAVQDAGVNLSQLGVDEVIHFGELVVKQLDKVGLVLLCPAVVELASLELLFQNVVRDVRESPGRENVFL